MFYGNRKTKIVHYQQCHYTKQIDAGRVEQFHSLEEAKAHGYRLCKSCSPIGPVKVRSKELKSFCEEENIRCYPQRGELLIMTQASEWKVTVGSGFKEMKRRRRKDRLTKKKKSEINNVLALIDALSASDVQQTAGA